MKKFIAYAIGLSQIIGMSVLTFENNTNLARRWEQDRQAVIAQIQANQTVQKGNEKPSFNKPAFDANVFHVDTYSDAYKCASKKDVTKCRSSYSY